MHILYTTNFQFHPIKAKYCKISVAFSMKIRYDLTCVIFHGCIAQLVERSVHTRYVESSILPTATMNATFLRNFRSFFVLS